LPVVELAAQGGKPPVHARGDGMVTDRGMDGVGEVQHGGAPRQGDDVAARGEDVHLVREQVDLDVLQELDGGAAARVRLDQVAEPVAGAVLRVAAGAVGLVRPVRGDAALGHHVHVFGADLHLDGGGGGNNEDGVQGLVAVGLGNGDEVAEAAIHRLGEVVHRAEGLVAVHGGVGDDADAVHVHDLGEGFAVL